MSVVESTWKVGDSGGYVAEDIAFVNTVDFTRTAKFYEKYGAYTLAPENSREFVEFWDIEEERRKYGMTMPGRLINNKLQEVHITGEHYGFLNYGRIIRTVDTDERELRYLVKDLKSARKVGKKDIMFPAFFDGQYHWFKSKEVARANGWHICAAKARRKGFSYMEAWDAADTININPNVIVLLGAYDMKYLTRPKKLMMMAKDYIDWLENETDFARGYLVNTREYVELGYIPQGSTARRGYRSSLVAASFMDNPDAGIGSDTYKQKWEEGGKFPNLIEALEVTLSAAETGDLITGQLVIFGTGGTKDANWEPFEKVYYNPGGWGFMKFENIWDDNMKHTYSGFYYPQELNLEPYIDEHGNSDINKSIEVIEERRKEKRENSNHGDYLMYIGQRSRKPSEAFNRDSDNIFSDLDIEGQLRRCLIDRDIKHLERLGTIKNTSEGIKFDRHNLKHPPIDEFPLKSGMDVDGCVRFWQLPYVDPITRKIPDNLYRLWHDPYGTDKDKSKITTANSLGATYIYERPNNFTPTRGDILIGSYVGRPAAMDDYNDQLMLLTMFTNGVLQFENDSGTVKKHFSNAKKYNLLADEPDFAWKKELAGKSGRNKGISMNVRNIQRISTAALYLRDYLGLVRGFDTNLNRETITLDYIYDVGLLKELLRWHLKGNFDRVSALLIGMFDREEIGHLLVQKKAELPKNSFFSRPLFVNR